MKKVKIKPDIYWVGGIDWKIRNFHGYSTQRGTTYNSYLIMDDKITLVDTVKHYLFDEMMDRIKEIVDPKKIDYIVSNHVEMDHSGGLPKILDVCPDAEVFTSVRGEKGLNLHYKKDLNLNVVKSGETLNIGSRDLHFVHIPMVHWPDSMVTYSPEDKLLLPNDAFGQHIASSARFDDELDWGILREEAAKYYANIVLPYGGQVQKALDAVKDLDFDMIAPSHGIIWRKHIPKIVKEYKKWSANKTLDQAVIVYDSMWGSTEKIAYSLHSGLEEVGIPSVLRNLGNNHISDVMTDVLDSKLVCIGSPTLNNGMMPTLGGFLTYLKGLRPKNRAGFVFGSYGWGGQAVGEIEKMLGGLSWDFPMDSINVNYVPHEKDFTNIRKIGNKLGKYLNK
jgi:flavorubredoxin